MKILLIIPAYNEELSILNTIHSIEEFSRKSKTLALQFVIDYVVINDGSTDNSQQVLMNHKKNAVHLVSNLGIGGAVQTGYKYALDHNYDIAIQFDGDGQHDIESLPTLIDPIVKGEHDFTIGSRFLNPASSEFQTTGMRKFGIRVISQCIKAVIGKRVYDVTSGYRAANKPAIHYLASDYPTKYPEPESIVNLYKQGFKLTEVPVSMFERQEGNSSITPLKSIRYMIEVCSAIIISFFAKGGEK